MIAAEQRPARDSRQKRLSSPEAIYALWRRLADFPAGDVDAALVHLMAWLAERMDADRLVWIGAVRVLRGEAAEKDSFLGWRLRVRRPLGPDIEPYRKQLAAYYLREHYGKLTPTYYERSHEEQEETHIGMTGRASMAGAGRLRVHRLRDGWIDFAAFQRTLHYRLYYRDAGIADRMTIGVPVDDDSESFFLIDRLQKAGEPRRRHFTVREAALARDVQHGLTEFHKRLFLYYGLLAGNKPLSPMEREILRGLLTGRTEKEIAVSMDRKPATLHKNVTSLYARFGVTSRQAFMALWLGGCQPASLLL